MSDDTITVEVDLALVPEWDKAKARRAVRQGIEDLRQHYARVDVVTDAKLIAKVDCYDELHGPPLPVLIDPLRLTDEVREAARK